MKLTKIGLDDEEKTPYWRLGINPSTKKEIYAKMPYFKKRHSSTTVVGVGETGSGKTTLMALIALQTSWHRPVIIFDYVGRDFVNGRIPNRYPCNLPPRMNPVGLQAYYFYYPIYNFEKREWRCRKKRPYETVVKPDFSKYDYRQYESLGLTGVAPRNLMKIMRDYGKFKNINTLYDFLLHFPTNNSENKFKRKQGRKASKHNKGYKHDSILRNDSKNSIVRDFYINVVNKGVWMTQNRMDVDYETLLLSGGSAIFSFNDLSLARAEISYFLDVLERVCDRNDDMIRPFLFFEEAHKIFGKSETYVDDKELQYIIQNLAFTGRKLGVGIYINLPTLRGLRGDIAGDVKEWFIGKLRGENLRSVKNVLGEAVAEKVRGLRKRRDVLDFETTSGRPVQGVREFLYFSTDKADFYPGGLVFKPYEAPQEYNRKM